MLKESFIVRLWAKIFGALEIFCPTETLRILFGDKYKWRYGAIDCYVLVGVVVSTFILLIQWGQLHPIGVVLCCCIAAYRIFETFVKLVNVLLFDSFRAACDGKKTPVKGYRRSLLLLALNYIDLTICFATLYLGSVSHFRLEPGDNLDLMWKAIYQSAQTMTTFSPRYHPADGIGAFIVLANMIIGLFTTALALAAAIGILPTRDSLDSVFGLPEDA